MTGLETHETDKSALYKDESAEKLMMMLYNDKIKLMPSFDLDHGYRYLEAEKVLEKEPEETQNFLARLSSSGILKNEPYEKSIACPSCSSHNVSSQYTCPHDQSTDIERDSLIEHLTCGHIGARNDFRRDGGLVCPQCNATLTTGSYRTIGSWNQCRSCGRRLEYLSVLHKCRLCGTEFNYAEAEIHDRFIYSLSEEAIAEIDRGIFYTSQLRNMFEESGFSIRVASNLTGESGIVYEFDIIAIDTNGNEIPVDVNFSFEPLPKETLMEEYGKFLDTRKESYLLVSPRMSEVNNKLNEALKMKIIQGNSPNETLDSFRKTISSMEHTQKEVTEKTSGRFFSRLKNIKIPNFSLGKRSENQNKET